MAAADHLSRQFDTYEAAHHPNPRFQQPYEGGHIGKYLYHHSAPGNRASIQQHGLEPRDPFNPEYHEDRGYAPTGVYLGPHETVHAGCGEDVWAVDTNEVHDLRPDPDDQDNYWGFHYSPNTIPPSSMRLVHRAEDERRTS